MTDTTQNLAISIADTLRTAIKNRGQAFLILPGGTSPRTLINGLAHQDLDWSRVTLTTTDERCVDPDHPHSNAGQIMRLFAAQKINVEPVLLWKNNAQNNAENLIWPSDVTVLGMGIDGHIASLFPGMKSDEQPGFLIQARAPAPPYNRVSLTMSAILNTERLILLTKGPEKETLYQETLKGQHSDLPLAELLLKAKQKLEIHSVMDA